MTQTHTSFKNKWENNPKSFYDDLLDINSEITQWVLNRNNFNNFEQLANYLKDKRRILDAGCGNGRITNLFAVTTTNEILGIDFASAEIAKNNLRHHSNVNIEQANLLDDLTKFGQFDFIYCQEVLHHTGNAEKGFKNLSRILAPAGEIAIYVYRQKAPTREFVDDHLRNIMKHMNYDQAIKISAAITQLGKVLSEVKDEICIPDLPEMGINAGSYTVQRFIYHHFMKCFWNDSLSWDENVTINYDWYHPEECTRHTLEEVQGWFKAENLQITHSYVDPYGITVWGKKS